MFTNSIPTMLNSAFPASTFSLFQDFDDLINSSKLSYSEPFPPVNVFYSADDKSCVIELALAGYTKDEFSISINGNKIIIEGKPSESEQREGKYLKQRIKKQCFRRAYEVPDFYDMSKADASYEDGLLTIEIPALEKQEVKPRVLKIR